jgi:hypothetical protein
VWGTLNASESRQIRRISTPVGVHARMAFRAQPVLAKVEIGSRAVTGRDICQKTLAACESRHNDMRVDDLKLTLITRSK